MLFILTCHSFIEYFGKGDQVPLQKALQNTVSILFIHSSLILLLTADYLRSHPDKVKLTGNDTAESVASRFVELTKAYKACANNP